MAQIDRELGELSTRLEVLEREMSEIKTDIRWMRDQVQQTKGGWKTIAFRRFSYIDYSTTMD